MNHCVLVSLCRPLEATIWSYQLVQFKHQLPCELIGYYLNKGPCRDNEEV